MGRMGHPIQVMYTMEVGCVVDIATGEIEDIQAYDGLLEPNSEFADDHGSPLAPDSVALTDRAQEIAASGMDWPAWRWV